MGAAACTGIETHILFWTSEVTELIQYNCDRKHEIWQIQDRNGDDLLLPVVSENESRDDVVIQDSLPDSAAGQIRTFASADGYFQTLEKPALLKSVKSGLQWTYTVTDPQTLQVYERQVRVSCGDSVEAGYLEITNAGAAVYAPDGDSANVAVYRIYRAAMPKFGLQNLYTEACGFTHPAPANALFVASE